MNEGQTLDSREVAKLEVAYRKLKEQLEQEQARSAKLIEALEAVPGFISAELLEMSAWMGIPEHKRVKQINYHIENIQFLVDKTIAEYNKGNTNE